MVTLSKSEDRKTLIVEGIILQNLGVFRTIYFDKTSEAKNIFGYSFWTTSISWYPDKVLFKRDKKLFEVKSLQSGCSSFMLELGQELINKEVI